MTVEPGSVFEVPIAIETDHEFFTRFASDTEAAAYVGDLVAFTSTVFESEASARLRITYLSLWETSNDPWETACRGSEFGLYWNQNNTSIDRALAHFLSGSANAYGWAWRGVLCRGAFETTVSVEDARACGLPQKDMYGGDYGISSGLNFTFDLNDPGMLWDIYVFLHELGHNFDSRHTHCYAGVGGSASPVDGCYAGQSGCYSGDETLPGVGSLTGGVSGQGAGTLMSYCHFRAGSYGNIGMTFGRHHPGGYRRAVCPG
ncbi:MAG: zinc-dependent metalloprotease [Gammaproteobacteria bacterium]|nr:zinc-dependent metalloprotease [Gammaproteobacteria bacterium]